MNVGDSGESLAISNAEAARVLFQVGALLETMQCNEYRVRAYRRAALAVLFLPRQLVDYVSEGKDIPLPGVGLGLRRRLHDLVNTGHLDAQEALLEEVGEPMASLLALQGVGPKTAIRLMAGLQIDSLADLAQAARDGRIRQLPGFGPVREERLRLQAEEHLGVAA